MKIISGGQTGADEAGLQFALDNGLEIGGYCPAEYYNERGKFGIKEQFRPYLTCTECYGYYERTYLNVLNSDLSLVFYSEITPGSRLTVRLCDELSKPVYWYCVDNPCSLNLQQVFQDTTKVINIAGSRESKCPGIYDKVLKLLNDEFNSRYN